MLFDSFETYDVQETRKISRAEGKAEGKADIIRIIRRKLEKKMSAEEIADMLELEKACVEEVAVLLRENTDKSDTEVAMLLLEKEEQE